MGRSTHITDEIFQIGGGTLTSFEDAAVYLVNFGGYAAVIDAGCGHTTDRLLDNIQSCGVDRRQIVYLLLTHCHYDHTGGAATLKQVTECRIVAHYLDAVFLEAGDNIVTAASWYNASLTPAAVDRRLTLTREHIVLGDRVIEAIHIPGHSPGSVAYLTESQGLKVLFGQDVHGPLAETLLSNQKHYFQSLELLASLEADILCEGHYGVYMGREEVDRFIRSFLPEEDKNA
ncbi:MAG TPA: MBL fold metallo-hydrolase [Desulfobacteraceae bacterium]|nr:MBL fold metallo-hydrolase [Desulfobacteraceae bacterium]